MQAIINRIKFWLGLAICSIADLAWSCFHNNLHPLLPTTNVPYPLPLLHPLWIHVHSLYNEVTDFQIHSDLCRLCGWKALGSIGDVNQGSQWSGPVVQRPEMVQIEAGSWSVQRLDWSSLVVHGPNDWSSKIQKLATKWLIYHVREFSGCTD